MARSGAIGGAVRPGLRTSTAARADEDRAMPSRPRERQFANRAVGSAIPIPLATPLLVLLPIAAVPRLWAAWFDHGMFWPDEIFQVTEPAHRIAFGYGFTSWEYHDGARSWVLPGMLAVVFRVMSAAGLHSGLSLMTGMQLLLAAGGVVTVGAAMVLAWRVGGTTASAIAGALAVAFPMLFVYGHHTPTAGYGRPV